MQIKHGQGFPRWYTVGAAEVEDPTLIKALVGTAAEITGARYDSFDSPRGTSYSVTAGKTLYISKVQGTVTVAEGSTSTIQIGYGDDHVENSAGAPTTAVAVWNTTAFFRGPQLIDIDVWIPIPAGKFPYVVAAGTHTFSVTGVEV